MSSPQGRSEPGPTGIVLPEMSPIQALWRGAVSALVVVLPVGVLNQYLVSSGELSGVSPVAILFWLLILLGGASGGWAVIRLSPQAPLPYAAGASAIAYLIVQSIGVILRLIGNKPIGWLGYPLLALFMATCGTLGGLYARRWLRQNDSAAPASATGLSGSTEREFE